MIVKDLKALSQPSEDVLFHSGSTPSEFDELASDIDRALEALISTPGALAVAGNQVGSRHRFFVAKYDLLKLSNATYRSLGMRTKTHPDDFGTFVYLNPFFEVVDYDQVESVEGCLSYEGEVSVPRYKNIIFQGTEIRLISDDYADLKVFKKKLKNLSSQIVQHEVDHLEGKGIWHYAK